MSAGELQGDGWRPPTRFQRVVDFASWLWFAAFLFCQFFFPESVWMPLLQAPIVILALLLWMLPRPVAHEDDEDWKARLTPPRRLILQSLTVLLVLSYLAGLYLDWAYGFDGDRSGALLAAWLVMAAIGGLAWPRNPNAEIDMRPVWAICSLLFAAFLYFTFTF
jgi:hypothetical protein